MRGKDSRSRVCSFRQVNMRIPISYWYIPAMQGMEGVSHEYSRAGYDIPRTQFAPSSPLATRSDVVGPGMLELEQE